MSDHIENSPEEVRSSSWKSTAVRVGIVIAAVAAVTGAVLGVRALLSRGSSKKKDSKKLPKKQRLRADGSAYSDSEEDEDIMGASPRSENGADDDNTDGHSGYIQTTSSQFAPRPQPTAAAASLSTTGGAQEHWLIVSHGPSSPPGIIEPFLRTCNCVLTTAALDGSHTNLPLFAPAVPADEPIVAALAAARAGFDADPSSAPAGLQPRSELRSLTDYDGIVVLGGTMGVYERAQYPFIEPELAFIRAVMAADIPLLGICLGAQLLAEATGGRVFASAHPPEIGVISLRPADTQAAAHMLLQPVEFMCASETSGISPATPLYSHHGDSFTLPPRAQLLAVTNTLNCSHVTMRPFFIAASPHDPRAALTPPLPPSLAPPGSCEGAALYRYPQLFVIGRAVGTQFHPEAKLDQLRIWAEKDIARGAGDKYVASVRVPRAEGEEEPAPGAVLRDVVAQAEALVSNANDPGARFLANWYAWVQRLKSNRKLVPAESSQKASKSNGGSNGSAGLFSFSNKERD